MSSAKPCLGYPSRTDAVLALRDLGQSDREIARRIGIGRHGKGPDGDRAMGVGFIRHLGLLS